jgi:uncharacterized cupredoxin-like copper-binding protein
MMRKWTRLLGVLAVIGAVSAGCIEESDEGAKTEAAAPHAAAPAGGAPAAATTVSATLTEWTIALSRDTVPQGTVSFEVRNSGTEDHALELEGPDNQEWKTDPIKPGESGTLSAALPPGTYTIYCPIASGGEAHADRGMKTTITVR